MKTIIILFASIALLASCEKQTVKTTTTTTPPLTVGETNTLLNGTWLCDSVQYYVQGNVDSTEISGITMTFDNGIASTHIPVGNFQYTFLDATNLSLSNFQPYSLQPTISSQNKAMIDHISVTHLELKCIQTYFGGQPANYAIRYFRRV